MKERVFSFEEFQCRVDRGKPVHWAVFECFGCYGLTDDCFGCPVADECEDFTIECEIDDQEIAEVRNNNTTKKVKSHE